MVQRACWGNTDAFFRGNTNILRGRDKRVFLQSSIQSSLTYLQFHDKLNLHLVDVSNRQLAAWLVNIQIRLYLWQSVATIQNLVVLTSIKMLSSEPSPGEHQVQMMLTADSFRTLLWDDKTYLAVQSDGSQRRKVEEVWWWLWWWWWTSFPSPPSSLPPPSSPIGQCRCQPLNPQRWEGGERAGNSILGASHTFVFLAFWQVDFLMCFFCICWKYTKYFHFSGVSRIHSIRWYGCRRPCFLWLC